MKKKPVRLIKPPLGIMPHWLWREQRMKGLAAAVRRYRNAGQKVPDEWTKELKERRAECRKHAAERTINHQLSTIN